MALDYLLDAFEGFKWSGDYVYEWEDGLKLLEKESTTDIRFRASALVDSPFSSCLDQLAFNDYTVHLRLQNCGIKDPEAMAVAKMLRTNSSLLSLDLSDNSIKVPGAISLAEALKVNHALLYLDLDNNSIQYEGMKAFADTLAVNDTLCTLRMKAIGVSGSTYEEEMRRILETNRGLERLFVSGGFDEMEMYHICCSLQKNYRLIEFELTPELEITETLLNRNFEYRQQRPTMSLLKKSKHKSSIWCDVPVLALGAPKSGKTSTILSMMGQPQDPRFSNASGLTNFRVSIRAPKTPMESWCLRSTSEHGPVNEYLMRKSGAIPSKAKKIAEPKIPEPEIPQEEVTEEVEETHSPYALFKTELLVKPASEPVRLKPVKKVTELHEYVPVGDPVNCTIWDFSSKATKADISRLFIKDHTVVVVCFSLAEAFETLPTTIHQLMADVLLFAPACKLILVGTHLDKVEEKKRLAKVTKIIKDALAGTSLQVMRDTKFNMPFFGVSNTTKFGLKSLRQIVRSAIESLLVQEVSLSWLALLNHLTRPEGEHQPFTEFKKVETVALNKKGVKYPFLKTKREVRDMINCFNDYGLLYHKSITQRLDQFIVLNTSWLYREATKLSIRSKDINDKLRQGKLIDEISKGFASDDVLKSIWGVAEPFLRETMHEHLLISQWTADTKSVRFVVHGNLVEQTKALDVSKSKARFFINFSVQDSKSGVSTKHVPNGVFERLACHLVLALVQKHAVNVKHVLVYRKSLVVVIKGHIVLSVVLTGPAQVGVFLQDLKLSRNLVWTVQSALRLIKQSPALDRLTFDMGFPQGNKELTYAKAKNLKLSPWFEANAAVDALDFSGFE